MQQTNSMFNRTLIVLLISLMLLAATLASTSVHHRHSRHHQSQKRRVLDDDYDLSDYSSGIFVDSVPMSTANGHKRTVKKSPHFSDSVEKQEDYKQHGIVEDGMLLDNEDQRGLSEGIAIDHVTTKPTRPSVAPTVAEFQKTNRYPKLRKFFDATDAERRNWYEAIFSARRR